MTVSEIRAAYLAFFKERGHAIVPSASLVPENDPTTLFTGSGMQPLLPYLLGAKHPSGTRLVDSQKCFRSMDIEEVGDNRHTTFFEMLGNWSLGDYFKKEQLPWFFEFLTGVVGLKPENLYVTAFIGDEKNGIPRDVESAEIWKQLFREQGIEAKESVMGSEADGYNRGMKEGERIFFYDAKKNWWSRAGVPENMPAGEPGGPDSEVFYDFGTPHDQKFGAHCHPNCDCGRFLEIGNSVFMEYVKNANGTFSLLPQKNVDFGGGLERIAAAKTENSDVFTVDLFKEAIRTLEASSGKSYTSHPKTTRAFRIILDHIRAAVFLVGDGVVPSNTDQGYVLRRLVRRAVTSGRAIGVDRGALGGIAQAFISAYRDSYPTLSERKELIVSELKKEEEKFLSTFERGLKEAEKFFATHHISGAQASTLVTTYGFPFEVITEIARERGVAVDAEGFRAEMEKHRELSRAGSEQKFKGGLADASEQTTKLHTATHLMLAGLRKYLGDHVHQAGSNITAERTRFDFTHPEKVTRDVLDKGEAYVNEAIAKACDVVVAQMPKEEARADGVEGSFWEKYPETVNVYMVKGADGSVYSRELCGGPHVTNTGDMGTFKILKEEASSAGVRRVKAVLE